MGSVEKVDQLVHLDQRAVLDQKDRQAPEVTLDHKVNLDHQDHWVSEECRSVICFHNIYLLYKYISIISTMCLAEIVKYLYNVIFITCLLCFHHLIYIICMLQGVPGKDGQRGYPGERGDAVCFLHITKSKYATPFNTICCLYTYDLATVRV